ncbi:MAG: conjugal transfer protein TraX [Lachnospiraceae bacterium]|nr:conjugal transfer protein TraX [Lachnospiraceae bacterium]
MNAFTLKLIACVSMLIDHIGDILFPGERYLRHIGRLAFPIYAFLLTEGFFHSRNLKRYAMRLFGFALISELPFDLAFYGELSFKHQNVYFTLFLGLVLLVLLKEDSNPVRELCYIGLICLIAQEIHCDYRYPGILMILFFAYYREIPFMEALSISICNMHFKSTIQRTGILALFPVFLYNGKRGPDIKYAFYLYYPMHLLALYFVKTRYF